MPHAQQRLVSIGEVAKQLLHQVAPVVIHRVIRVVAQAVQRVNIERFRQRV